MSIRAVVLAVVLSVLCMLWMHQAGLVQAPGLYVATVYLFSVPPVPAMFALMLLVVLAPLSGRIFKQPINPREMLFCYMVLVIVIPLVTFGMMEMLLPHMTVGLYLAAPGNNFTALAESMPEWFYPHDAEAIRMMYEGSESGVPWGPWIKPLAMWTIWLTAFFVTFLCITTLFHRQWTEHERLRYPLLLIPLSIVERQVPGGHVTFFRNPLVWIGILIVLTHHTLNIAHAYNPAVVALGDRFLIGQELFTERPWRPFAMLRFMHRPQVIGLAYFVPVDILFSGWFFYLLQPALRCISDIFGITPDAEFPYDMAQSGGGYVAMMLVIFWTGRHELARIARKALTGDPSVDDSDQPLPHRWAFFGAVGGTLGLLIWTVVMGAPWLQATMYMVIFISTGFVLARIRAEGGIPSMWGPAPRIAESIFEFTGTRSLTAGGNLSGLAVIRILNWVSRSFLGAMSAFHAENHRLSDQAGIDTRKMPAVQTIAFVLGCIFAYYIVLNSYYQYGALVLGGGTTEGGYNVWEALRSWKLASAAVDSPSAPSPPHMIAAISAMVAVVGMVVARWRWLRSPFHPLGYVSCVWYGLCLWGPFMAVWAIKLLVHRMGGARLYRQLMPFFLGLAFGDLLAGGIAWILIGVFGPEITNGYMVQFG